MAQTKTKPTKTVVAPTIVNNKFINDSDDDESLDEETAFKMSVATTVIGKADQGQGQNLDPDAHRMSFIADVVKEHLDNQSVSAKSVSDKDPLDENDPLKKSSKAT